MTDTRRLATSAVCGAAYAALTLALAPISFGAVQCRLSEALCVLPFFLPGTAWGLWLGCMLANLLAGAGLPDVMFGALGTLAAGLAAARLGRVWRQSRGPIGWKRRVAVCLMPAVCNGPIVGAVLARVYTPDAFLPGFLLMGAEVAAGELLAGLALGLPLMALLSGRLSAHVEDR